jgi:hypothetical protein
MVARILIDEGAPAASIDYDACRTAAMIIRCREIDLRIRDRRKLLVPLQKVKLHIEKAFTGYKQAMQRLPARHAAGRWRPNSGAILQRWKTS